MNEGLRPDIKTPEFNPTLDFVLKRISASRGEVRRLVAGFLEQNRLAEGFTTFVNALPDGRKRYSLQELRQRDALAVERADHSLTEESAARSIILKREDEGIPKALELFFLMLLSPEEWREVCSTKEQASELGALTARNAIDSVLTDEPRTKKFVHAVQSEVGQFGDSDSMIYDAGCGPFPVLSIAAALAAPRAKVVGLEINPLSARIAQAVVGKFVASGAIAENQVYIREGNALHEAVPPKGSVDLFISETLGAGLLDERAPAIFSRYASCVNTQRGSTIPYRAKLSASLVPINQGVSFDEDGKTTSRYEFIINTNGREWPVVPAHAWSLLENGREIPLTEIPSKITGTLPVPADLSAEAFNLNYAVAISTELIIDRSGSEVATRYETFVTTPVLLGDGIVSVPRGLKDTEPGSLEVRFSFQPGAPSNEKSLVEVVRRAGV